MQNRREFMKQTSGLVSLMALAPLLAEAGFKSKKAILLRSSWQTFNIGDIAHTPGVLAILEKQLPDVSVRLWPMDVGHGVEEILKRRFPKVTIVKSEEEVKKAFVECDFMLHGSGPSLVGRNSLARWSKETGKPYGVYGITFPGVYAAKDTIVKPLPLDLELLSKASFVFFRDSVSLDFAIKSKVTCKVMAFGPDATFAVDLRNDQAAISFLKDHGLEEGKFLCCIPRLRFTQEWLAKGKNRPYVQAQADRNELMKEHDNAPLRAAIIAVVRQTPMKVLVCPEDETHVALGKELIMDRLPEDVKAKVVWRDRYWLTDEALSTYTRSAGLFGLEMHSPIICIGNGIPAIVCRFFEQSTKGYMWRDIGLGDWLFDMDVQTEVDKIIPAVLAIAKNPGAAKVKAEQAKLLVQKKQEETMKILKGFI
jgi:hypothetical protein